MIFHSYVNSPELFPYAPCMEYLPTFALEITQMLVNIPYMEHMGLAPTSLSPAQKSIQTPLFLLGPTIFSSKISSKSRFSPLSHGSSHGFAPSTAPHPWPPPSVAAGRRAVRQQLGRQLVQGSHRSDAQRLQFHLALLGHRLALRCCHRKEKPWGKP